MDGRRTPVPPPAGTPRTGRERRRERTRLPAPAGRAASARSGHRADRPPVLGSGRTRAAERLDQVEPAWIVWYGPGTRHFHAVAVWPAPEPLIVRARTVDELRDLMREAEHGPPPPRGENMPEIPDTPPAPDGSRTQDAPLTVCWDLPHNLPIVGKARAMVREILVAWELHHLVDDAVLVAGELLANAIVHGEPVVRLSVRACTDELRLQVTDRGTGQPRLLALDAEAVHGRGLAIVRALAHDHGVTPLPDRPGKTVWARWRLPSHDASPTSVNQVSGTR
ncbi:ATP-binding protein [Streptosporangium sp. H16]|uniref:ATP-binding protein n=1 Tax=Streptosporangium sp. H16 TaxID=3444184 RepID=UPI003F7AB6A4